MLHYNNLDLQYLDFCNYQSYFILWILDYHPMFTNQLYMVLADTTDIDIYMKS